MSSPLAHVVATSPSASRWSYRLGWFIFDATSHPSNIIRLHTFGKVSAFACFFLVLSLFVLFFLFPFWTVDTCAPMLHLSLYSVWHDYLFCNNTKFRACKRVQYLALWLACRTLCWGERITTDKVSGSPGAALWPTVQLSITACYCCLNDNSISFGQWNIFFFEFREFM